MGDYDDKIAYRHHRTVDGGGGNGVDWWLLCVHSTLFTQISKELMSRHIHRTGLSIYLHTTLLTRIWLYDCHSIKLTNNWCNKLNDLFSLFWHHSLKWIPFCTLTNNTYCPNHSNCFTICHKSNQPSDDDHDHDHEPKEDSSCPLLLLRWSSFLSCWVYKKWSCFISYLSAFSFAVG